VSMIPWLDVRMLHVFVALRPQKVGTAEITWQQQILVLVLFCNANGCSTVDMRIQ